MSSIAVKLTNVGKKYKICYEKPTLMGSTLGQKTKKEFWALKNINLTIKKGEKVGLTGLNGVGKSTLLKIIAGLTTPTTGKLETNGKIATLMSLEAGFHPDLSGWENIYLNGMLVGMTKDEVRSKNKKILDYSEIGKFIEAPLYTYSDGMKFRLAFSIAIASEFDILIIDEIITAGDIQFQEKVLSTLEKISKKRNITVIICSHFPQLVWRYSKTFFEIDKGGKLKKLARNEMLKRARENIEGWRKHLQL